MDGKFGPDALVEFDPAKMQVDGRAERPRRSHDATLYRYKQAADDRLAGLNTLKFSVWISRGAGLVLSVDGMLILLPVCRTIVRWVRPKLRFIPLDENIWFHRQIAYAMVWYSFLHTAAHYVK